jgi:hypothetical protein
VWSISILLAGNWHDIGAFFANRWKSSAALNKLPSSEQVAVDDQMSPHLNEVLRKELLHYTTQGIKTAVRQAQLDRESGKRSIGTFSALPGSSFFVSVLCCVTQCFFICRISYVHLLRCFAISTVV